MNGKNMTGRFFVRAAVLVLAVLVLHENLQGANPTQRTQPRADSKQGSNPLSEVEFHITETLSARARLLSEKVEETVLPDPYGCRAPAGGKETRGKFRLEFEIDGKRVATYFLDLSFVEDHFWNPQLKKSSVPLAGQSREQIVIIQYQTYNTIEALIFGYDLKEKEIVRYSFSDSEPWRVSLSVGTRFLPDGRVQVLEVSKPDGVLQKRIYNNAVWGTFLDRYSFDPLTQRFLKIPMVVGMRVHLVTPGRSTTAEIVLYEDGYFTDMVGGEKFVPKIEVHKLLNSEAAEGVLRLREKSGGWLSTDFGSDPPIHDFSFSIRDRKFSARCGQRICPKEIQFIRDKLLKFWREDFPK